MYVSNLKIDGMISINELFDKYIQDLEQDEYQFLIDKFSLANNNQKIIQFAKEVIIKSRH